MNKRFFCYLLVIGFAIGGLLIGSFPKEEIKPKKKEPVLSPIERQISILNVYDNKKMLDKGKFFSYKC